MNSTTILKVLLEVLTEKALLILSLLMNFGLFVAASANPSDNRILVAGLFSLLCFLPVLWKGTKDAKGTLQEKLSGQG
jgi:hypothetical protein